MEVGEGKEVEMRRHHTHGAYADSRLDVILGADGCLDRAIHIHNLHIGVLLEVLGQLWAEDSGGQR